MLLTKLYFLDSQVLLTIRRFLFLICLSLVFIISGCGNGSTDADYSPNGSGSNGGGGGGGEIGTAPTFDNVGQLFLSSCGDCHTTQQESGVRLNTYTNVMESVGAQYGTLVIQPGDAAGSPLVDKIESDNPEFGARMPDGGPYLTPSRINQIRAWIDNGAHDDVDDNNDDDNDDDY